MANAYHLLMLVSLELMLILSIINAKIVPIYMKIVTIVPIKNAFFVTEDMYLLIC